MTPHKPHILVGGRLKFFQSKWFKLTNDPQVLDIVTGMHIELDDIPQQTKVPKEYFMSDQEISAAKEHIDSLLQKCAIVSCSHDEEGQFYSNIFMIPKHDTGHRMILNLKFFNQYVTYVKFKMQTLNHILLHIQLLFFLATFDFCDAYLSCPIAGEHVKFLRFKFLGKSFMYMVLPFGISSAPRKFSKVLIPILSFLRQQGFIVIMYLDDGFTCAPTCEQCKENICYIMHTFSYYGFIIHPKKSAPVPSQRVGSLGFYIDSVAMTVSLPTEKIERAIHLCSSVLFDRQKQFTIQYLAQIIGTLISLFPACPLGRLYYRSLERLKITALRISHGNFDGPVIFNDECFRDLQWWLDNLPHTAAPINHGLPSDTIFTDSSDYAWSGVFNGSTAQGFFTPKEKDNIVAFKELLAIYYALLSFHQSFSGNLILIRSDSVCTVAYIGDMGGIANLQMDSLAKDIWMFAQSKNLWLQSSFLKGSENTAADVRSCILSIRTEWTIPWPIFYAVCSILGTPTIDLFASCLNARLPCYISWVPDPYSLHVDALTVSWQNEFPYLFPPFAILHRCLQQIVTQKIDQALLIFPLWMSQYWMAQVLQLAASEIYLLPETPEIFLPWETTHTPHPLGSKLLLGAVLLSTNPRRLDNFHQRLQPSSAVPLDNVLKRVTRQNVSSGIYLQNQKVLIPICQL